MSKLYLFTSLTCPKCPAAKELIKTHNLDCEIIEVGVTPGGENKALSAKVRQAPQFVIKTGATYELVDFKNEEEFERIYKEFTK